MLDRHTYYHKLLYKKWSVPLRISSVNVSADLVIFTEEILNGKLHFLCSEQCWIDTDSDKKSGAKIAMTQIVSNTVITIIGDLDRTIVKRSTFPRDFIMLASAWTCSAHVDISLIMFA